MNLQDALPAAGSPNLSTGSTSTPLKSLLLRCVLAYILLYVFPFPLGSFPKGAGIPWTDWLTGRYEDLMHMLVPWVGRICFGVAITRFPAGSGDTTYNYVELFFTAS